MLVLPIMLAVHPFDGMVMQILAGRLLGVAPGVSTS